MPSDSAPPADSHGIILAADRAGKENDPVSRLLTEPPGPARGLQVRHWAGVVILALTVGGAAFVLPPLISAKGPTALSPGPSSANPQVVSQQQPAAPVPSIGASAPGSAPPKATTGTQAGPGVVIPRPTTASRTPTAKATTTPAAAPPPSTKAPAGVFTPLSIQAENATLSDGARTTDCAPCGGGQRVRYVGRIDAQFTVPVSGERTVTVTYMADQSRMMTVTVNGTAVMTARRVTGTSWVEPQTVSVTATVPAGTVTIAVTGAPNGPDLDAISIS